jgi:hypothetical protein
MSALGHKRTYWQVDAMSAVLLKVDVDQASPLSAKSGHPEAQATPGTNLAKNVRSNSTVISAPVESVNQLGF